MNNQLTFYGSCLSDNLLRRDACLEARVSVLLCALSKFLNITCHMFNQIYLSLRNLGVSL